jgi:hypothetical protein
MVARHFSGGYAVEMTRVPSARLKRTRDAADDISAAPKRDGNHLPNDPALKHRAAIERRSRDALLLQINPPRAAVCDPSDVLLICAAGLHPGGRHRSWQYSAARDPVFSFRR